MLGGQFLYKNVHKLGSISYSSCFGCFQCKRCVYAMNLHLFHNNPLLSVSWGEMRFWVFLEEKHSLSKFSDERLNFARNWANNEDLILAVHLLCKIIESYILLHIHPVLDVSNARDVFLRWTCIFFKIILFSVFLDEKWVSECFCKKKTV